MNNIKAITSIPGWTELLEQADKVKTEPAAYTFVPLTYRAVRLRSDAISSVPYEIRTIKGDAEAEWPYRADFESLIWSTEAALLLAGAAYWLKLEATMDQDVIWLNPFYVEVNFNPNTGRSTFLQNSGAGVNGPWQEEQIVYFREWDPLQDTNPGISPARVSLGNSQLQHYVTRFAYHFFEGGAMPVTVLGMENVLDAELKRTEGIFKKVMSSISNAFRIIGVRADSIDIKTITPPLSDLALNELYEQSKKNIASAFGIPMTMLEEPAANRATAESHRLSFWADTVRPRGRFLENVINRQLLEPIGLVFKFNFDELDVFQADENERAASLQALVTAGLPLDISLRTLGFELSDEDWEAINQEKQDRADRRDAMLANFAGSDSQDQESQDEDEDEDEDEKTQENLAKKIELKTWRRKVKKALSRRIELEAKPDRTRSEKKWLSSYPTFTRWESKTIPSSIVSRMTTLIQACRTMEDIDEVFDRFDDTIGGSVDELVDTLREAIEVIASKDPDAG